jgi:ribosome silencing factor RsfS/YbeB/iojap
MTISDRCKRIATLLDEKKAENIEVFDLSDSGYFVDAVVVATSIASKHAIMLVDEIKKTLKKDGESILNVDDSDDWTIVDMGDILIHLMSSEYRKKYDLEEFLREFEAKKRG